MYCLSAFTLPEKRPRFYGTQTKNYYRLSPSILGAESILNDNYLFVILVDITTNGNGTLRRAPPETGAKPHTRIISPSKTVNSPHKILPKDMDDLIHLQGPLTEDAVMRTLHARFNDGKYIVSTEWRPSFLGFMVIDRNLCVLHSVPMSVGFKSRQIKVELRWFTGWQVKLAPLDNV